MRLTGRVADEPVVGFWDTGGMLAAIASAAGEVR